MSTDDIASIDDVLCHLTRNGKMLRCDADGTKWTGLTDVVAQQIVKLLLKQKALIAYYGADFLDIGAKSFEFCAKLGDSGEEIKGTIQFREISGKAPQGAVSFEEWQQSKGYRGV